MKGNSVGSSQQSPNMFLIVESGVTTEQKTSIHTGFPLVIPSDAFRQQTVRLECFADGHAQSVITYAWKKVNVFSKSTS